MRMGVGIAMHVAVGAYGEGCASDFEARRCRNAAGDAGGALATEGRSLPRRAPRSEIRWSRSRRRPKRVASPGISTPRNCWTANLWRGLGGDWTARAEVEFSGPPLRHQRGQGALRRGHLCPAGLHPGVRHLPTAEIRAQGRTPGELAKLRQSTPAPCDPRSASYPVRRSPNRNTRRPCSTRRDAASRDMERDGRRRADRARYAITQDGEMFGRARARGPGISSIRRLSTEAWAHRGRLTGIRLYHMMWYDIAILYYTIIL